MEEQTYKLKLMCRVAAIELKAVRVEYSESGALILHSKFPAQPIMIVAPGQWESVRVVDPNPK